MHIMNIHILASQIVKIHYTIIKITDYLTNMVKMRFTPLEKCIVSNLQYFINKNEVNIQILGKFSTSN